MEDSKRKKLTEDKIGISNELNTVDFTPQHDEKKGRRKSGRKLVLKLNKKSSVIFLLYLLEDEHNKRPAQATQIYSGATLAIERDSRTTSFIRNGQFKQGPDLTSQVKAQVTTVNAD